MALQRQLSGKTGMMWLSRRASKNEEIAAKFPKGHKEIKPYLRNYATTE